MTLVRREKRGSLVQRQAGDEEVHRCQRSSLPWIDKNAKYIKRMKVFDKNGTHYTYQVTSFNSKANLEDSFFKFDASKHPGVHIEDLRM